MSPRLHFSMVPRFHVYVSMFPCIHLYCMSSCLHVSIFAGFGKQRMELTENYKYRLFALLQTEMVNGSVFHLGGQTVNGNQRLLFQQMCQYLDLR